MLGIERHWKSGCEEGVRYKVGSISMMHISDLATHDAVLPLLTPTTYNKATEEYPKTDMSFKKE